MELCQTRIKKSSHDMLNFYVVSAGRDMVNDTDRSTTCRSKFRATPLQRKTQKMKVRPKIWISPNNRLNIPHQNLKTFTFGIKEKKQRDHKTPMATTEDGPCNHEEIN